MNAPKFSVGQAVVCLKHPGQWVAQNGSDNMLAPKKGEICRVVGLEYDSGDWYLILEGDWVDDEGWQNLFWEEHFAPVELLPDEALAELIAEALEAVTA